MVYKPFTAKTTTGQSTVFHPETRGKDAGLIQINISGGTATVRLLGRLSPEAPWFEIMNTTTSTLQWCALTTQMVVEVQSISGATVDAWVDG